MANVNTHSREKLDKEISLFVVRASSDRFRPATRKGITYEDFLNNKILISAAIRAGIPSKLFHLIQEGIPLSDKDWADMLSISPKTFHKFKSSTDHCFSPVHSEKIIELAEVTLEGLETFGEVEKFRLWLDTPNFALGGYKPIELLNNSYGKELVMNELVRINHGILV